MSSSEIEVEVFRVGPHSRGITERDVDEAAASYNPDSDPAPLVIGHPANDDPAHGVIAKVRRVGNALMATFRHISEEAMKGVRERRYINRSTKFWHPDDPSNPTPGRWNVRHVGLLGAASPGIPGMPALAFANAWAFAGLEPAGPVFSTGRHDGSTAAEVAEITAAANDLKERAKARGRDIDFGAACGVVGGDIPWDNPGELSAARSIGAEFAATEHPYSEPVVGGMGDAAAMTEARGLAAGARYLLDRAAERGWPVTFEAAVYAVSGEAPWSFSAELAEAKRIAGDLMAGAGR